MQGTLSSALPLVPVALAGQDRVARQVCPVLCSRLHSRALPTGMTLSVPYPACARHPWNQHVWRSMKGTPFAQFSTEVLQRGAAAVLPQHLPDRWLDTLLEEADLLAPGEGDP